MIETTPHPKWVVDFIAFLRPFEDRVVNSRIFKAMNDGTLTVPQFQGGLINFYPLVESFPHYMELSLTKIPESESVWNSKTRCWLLNNINQERVHAAWWREWATGLGVSPHTFDHQIYPSAEMDAINNYLWRIATYGTLAESISAVNFAIEGPTGVWTKAVAGGLQSHYGSQPEWVSAHAAYDDRHPIEALEIIKAFATTKLEQERVTQSARRALEYYFLALENCFEQFGS